MSTSGLRAELIAGRREIHHAVGGAAFAWPLAVGAEQPDGLRRIGLLMGWSVSNPEFRGLVATFVEELAQLGSDRRPQRADRGALDGMRHSKRASAFATELIASQPEVILSSTTPATAALHRGTTIIPIVFTVVVDPVRAGFVASLPRPGGNITGFRHQSPALAASG